MTTHDEVVRSLKVMIEAAKADDPISHVALEGILRYVETLKPRPDHCGSMAIDDAWSRLHLIIAEPQIPITSGDVKALTVLRDHMLAEKQRIEEKGQEVLKMIDQGLKVRERLETKAQDLLKEIYRL